MLVCAFPVSVPGDTYLLGKENKEREEGRKDCKTIFICTITMVRFWVGIEVWMNIETLSTDLVPSRYLVGRMGMDI